MNNDDANRNFGTDGSNSSRGSDHQYRSKQDKSDQESSESSASGRDADSGQAGSRQDNSREDDSAFGSTESGESEQRQRDRREPEGTGTDEVEAGFDEAASDEAGADEVETGFDEVETGADEVEPEFEEAGFDESELAEPAPMAFKRRVDAEPLEVSAINWKMWTPVIIAITVAVGAAAAWSLLSADGNTGELRVVSTQEIVTDDCNWTIAYEVQNFTDVPLQAIDTSVVPKSSQLYVTQAAPDIIIAPRATATNIIVYGVASCPATVEEVDHGPLEVFYADSTGKGQTLSADF